MTSRYRSLLLNVMFIGYLFRKLILSKFEDGSQMYLVYVLAQATLPLVSNLTLLGARCLFCKGEITATYRVIRGN